MAPPTPLSTSNTLSHAPTNIWFRWFTSSAWKWCADLMWKWCADLIWQWYADMSWKRCADLIWSGNDVLIWASFEMNCPHTFVNKRIMWRQTVEYQYDVDSDIIHFIQFVVWIKSKIYFYLYFRSLNCLLYTFLENCGGNSCEECVSCLVVLIFHITIIIPLESLDTYKSYNAEYLRNSCSLSF